MKKIFILAALLAVSTLVYSQNESTKTTNIRVVKVENKTFKAVKTNSSKGSDYKPTGFYYQLKSGEKREIYLHTKTRGDRKGQTACYIQNPRGGWREIAVKPQDLK